MISELSLGVLCREEAIAAPERTSSEKRTGTIRYMIDQGVNFINLGHPLLFKNPETACEYVKNALDGGYREKVKLAINVPTHRVSSQQELSNSLAAQLELFGLDSVDFCVLDGVNRFNWAALKSIGISAWVESISASRISSHAGIAFHDDPHYLKDINGTYPHWAFVQMELSLLDYKHHPGAGGFKFTQEYNNGVIAAGITKSGRLLKNIPENVEDVLENAQVKQSPEERCVKWVLAFEEVSSAQLSIESECPTTKHAQRYLRYAEDVTPGEPDVWESLDAARIRDAYYANRDYLCTSCYCCMPCAVGIDAPRIIELVNDGKMFSNSAIPKLQYSIERHQDIECLQCGLCNKHCPKRLPIQKIVLDASCAYAQK
ncbi:MAG: aldo/keto reductase [Oscillospiraceae bacterium]|nr:aldo/keto reductase [Oscillospiraceae bacterium]